MLLLLSSIFAFVTVALGQKDPNVPRYCTPTGAGVCNLGIEWANDSNYDGIGNYYWSERAAWVYNRYCGNISENLVLTPYSPHVGSIFIDFLADGFQYGVGENFTRRQWDSCYCYSARDEGYQQACQCAFPC
jgi:hypothetical protein